MKQERFFYIGTSMLGVFAPGDEILATKVDFEQLQVGDIVVYFSPENKQKRFVHRVIEKNADSLQTHGDNNLTRDLYRLKKGDDLWLVREYLRKGELKNVTYAEAGWQEFCANQRRRKLLHLKSLCGRLIAKIVPLRWFAPNKDRLKIQVFKRQGVAINALLFLEKKQVALYDFDAEIWRVCGRWKWFYSSKALSGFNVKN